jgi:GNAT superfamily N-acetyltransferase
MQIASIADHLDLVPVIAKWHFAEWGHLDPDGTLASWTEGLGHRTKREAIPTTYVALEEDELLGSVTLVEQDMLTRPDLSPWVAGVYVAAAQRHRGIGSALVGHAVRQAAQMGIERLYLYTHPARAFYQKLGWQVLEEVVYEGRPVAIMMMETAKAR